MAQDFKLLDDDDLYYLELDRHEINSAFKNREFKDLIFDDPDTALLSIIDYCYTNFMFAAKLLLNVELLPFQAVTLEQMFSKNFFCLVACRGYSKSFQLAVYALLRAILIQGSRIVLISASFRQSKVVFNYINDIYKSSSSLQQVSGKNKPRFDIAGCSFQIGNSSILSIPLGNGEKVRGLRGNCILIDEFAAIPESIFEIVVRGFSVVSLDPVSKVKEKYRIKEMQKTGIDTEEIRETGEGNQIIISGTAYYQFNHFYKYYNQYLKIIECGNDRAKLKNLFGDDMTQEELNSLDPSKFGVMRVPYYCLPPAYLDESIISQGRATMSKSGFDMEFGAEFYADSDGFIPMSMLDSVSMYRPYGPIIKGESRYRYVMGVDPARQRDHFSIVIIEVDDEGKSPNKVVYCWATNEKKMKSTGEVNENQTYYGACARKIRKITRAFNVVLINIDAGGGGREIANYLQEKTFLLANEEPYWEIDNKDHRLYAGSHILKITPSSSQWATAANHSFRKSIEEFQLLFPIYDTEAIEDELTAGASDATSMSKIMNKNRISMIDTVEDVNEEIKEMKSEISNIVVTETANGHQNFDLPKIRIPSTSHNKISDKRRKDRYSACVLAHDSIQYIKKEEIALSYEMGGGTKESFSGSDISGEMYRGLPVGITRGIDSPTFVTIDSTEGGGRIVF